MTKKPFLFFVLLAFTSASLAQQTFSLEQCRDLALENNHEIKAAQSQTESIRNTQKSYRANYFPSIKLDAIGLYSTLNGDYQFDLSSVKQTIAGLGGALGPVLMQLAPQAAQALANINIPEVGLEYKAGPMFLGGVSLTQPIYMGGKIKNATHIASMGVEMAEKNENLTRVKVIEATDQAYALVVKAKEMQKVALLYNQVLVELMGNVVKAKNNGMKTGNDVLKVQVVLNESELAMQKAANAVALAKMNLCHIVGMDLLSDIDVEDKYPSIEVREGSVANRPETAILDKKLQIAEAKADIEKSGIRPEVGAMLSYNYLYGFELNDETLFNDGAFTAMVKVSIPIFNFGKNTNKVRAAKNSVEQTRMEQRNLTEKMELEQQRAKNNLDEARKEKVVAEKSLEQAAENMRASKSMFDNGMETLGDYLESQLLWQKAMATRVNAEYQLYLAIVDFNRTSGTLVD